MSDESINSAEENAVACCGNPGDCTGPTEATLEESNEKAADFAERIGNMLQEAIVAQEITPSEVTLAIAEVCQGIMRANYAIEGVAAACSSFTLISAHMVEGMEEGKAMQGSNPFVGMLQRLASAIKETDAELAS